MKAWVPLGCARVRGVSGDVLIVSILFEIVVLQNVSEDLAALQNATPSRSVDLSLDVIKNRHNRTNSFFRLHVAINVMPRIVVSFSDNIKSGCT